MPKSSALQDWRDVASPAADCPWQRAAMLAQLHAQGSGMVAPGDVALPVSAYVRLLRVRPRLQERVR